MTDSTQPPADEPSADEPSGGASPGEVPADADAAEEPEEEQEELLHASTPLPSLAVLREALDWAFAREEVDPALLDRFARHALLVLEGNRRMNLTSIVDPREMAAKHYLDSWRTTRFLPILGRTVLDLGTGAGFPAIPMALSEPSTRFIALDSRRKRVEFVADCVAELGLTNVEPVWARGEEWLVQNKVDVVVTRALSSVRENVRLLRKVRHQLKELVMLKGKSWSREMRSGEREAERLGFSFDTVWEHELPGELGARGVLIYRAPGSR